MTYKPYKEQIKDFVIDTVNHLNLGSEVLLPSLACAGSIEWTKARPSTIANVLVLLMCSGIGLDIEKDVVDKRATTIPTLVEWKIYLRERLAI